MKKTFYTLLVLAACAVTSVAAPITMLEVPDATPVLDSSDPFGFGYKFTLNGTDYYWTNQPSITVVGQIDGGYVASVNGSTGAVSVATVAQGAKADAAVPRQDGSSTNQTLVTATVPTFLSFTTNTVGALSAGQISWDSDWRTFKLGLGNGVENQVGQESQKLAKNVWTNTIPNGWAVMRSGAVGNSGKLEIVPAIATVGMSQGRVVGVATEDIAVGALGLVTIRGNVNQIGSNGSLYGSSGWLDMADLYLSHVYQGYLTTNMPPAPYPVVYMGSVINAANNGTIDVSIHCGTSMQNLNDVNGTPLTESGQFPVWDNERQVFDFAGNTNQFASVETDAKFATNTVLIVRDGVVKGLYGTNLYAAAEAAVSGDKITLSAGDYHIYQRGIVLADGVSMSGAGSGVSRIIETGMDNFVIKSTASSAVVRVGSDSVIENVGVLCDWSTFGDARFIFGIGAFNETNVTIRNCYVRGASDAVYFLGTRNAKVERCDIETAFDGVVFFTDPDTGIGSEGSLSWSRVNAVSKWPTNEFFPDTSVSCVGIADGSTGVVSFCEITAIEGDLQNIGIKVTAAGHGEAYNNTIYVRDAGKTGEGWESLTYGLLTESGYLLDHNNQYAASSGTLTYGTFRFGSFLLDGTTINSLEDGAVNASTVTNIVTAKLTGYVPTSRLSLTNGTIMADGVLNGTNGLFFVPFGSTNRYWILGGQ